MKFVISRYYFDSLFKAQAEQNFITDIQADPVLKSGNYSYAIGHVSADELGEEPIIRGQLGRIPSEDAGFVYDTQAKDFVQSERQEFADAIIEFFAIPSKKLLLFELSSHFNYQTVANKFKQIYLQSNQSYVGGFDIDFILDGENVYEEIKEWKRFTRVQFKNLRPSNPDPRDDYAEIEELIKQTGGDRTDLDIKMDGLEGGNVDKPGINVDSKLIRQALALSSNGYGNGEITGVDDEGYSKTVRTYKYKKTVEIDFRDDGSVAKIKEIVEGVGDEDE